MNIKSIFFLLLSFFTVLNSFGYSYYSNPKQNPTFVWTDTTVASEVDTLIYENAEDSLVSELSSYRVKIIPEKNIIGNADAMNPFFRLLSLPVAGSGNTVSIYHLGDSHIAGKSYPNSVAKYLHQLYGDGKTTIIVPKYKPRRGKHLQRVQKKKSAKLKRGSTKKSINRNRKRHSTGILNEADIFQYYADVNELIQFPNLIRPSGFEEEFEQKNLINTGALEHLGYYAESILPLNETNHTDSIAKKLVTCNYTAYGVAGKSFKYFAESPVLLAHLDEYKPHLAIISLGVNDIFGKRYDEEYIQSNMTRLVQIIRERDSSVCILLAITGDAYKKKKTNPFLPRLREQMIRFANSHNCAYWNPVPVFGGYGYMNKWYTEKLCIRDRVHLTKTGYSLLGRTLSEAINKTFILYKDMKDNLR